MLTYSFLQLNVLCISAYSLQSRQGFRRFPLKHLKQAFGEFVENFQEYKTPTTPKVTIVCPNKHDLLINPERQKLFRSGVGMLLYLVKHSRLDINNADRELTKITDQATEAHWKELL
jgi:hypothetical protein